MNAITPFAVTPRLMLAAVIMTTLATPTLATTTTGVITAVDVHPGEARVTRVVPVPGVSDAKSGERTLVIGPLPRRVLPLSLSVETDAESDIIVLDVRHRRRPPASSLALDAAIASVGRSLKTNVSLRAEVERQSAVLDRLGRFGAEATGLDAKRGLLDAGSVAQFTQQLFTDRDGLVHRADELERAAARPQPPRRALGGGGAADEMADVHEVVVRLAGGTTGSGLRLNYRVSGVHWEITYEARARSGASELELTQFASISQETGEDWRDARLQLFSTPPHVAASASRLKPLRLSLSRAASGDAHGAVPIGLAELLHPSVDEPSRRGERVNAEARHAPRFRATVTATVLDSATPRRVALGAHSLDAMVLHVAQPRLGPDVFRRAALTNTTGRSLPAGPVQVWMDGEAAGEFLLAQVPGGAEFDVGLGVDSSLTATRVVVSREESTRANRRIVTLKLALAVSSTSFRDVALEVVDVIPSALARSGIKVTELDANPTPNRASAELGEQGKGYRRWSASLEPGQQWQADYGYRVEYDAAFKLGALLTE